MFEVELMNADEVAKILHTTAPKVKSAILNGTMPIGAVGHGGKDRIIIVKRRFLAWINAKDLGE